MQRLTPSVIFARHAVLTLAAVLCVLVCVPAPRVSAACSPSVSYGQVSLSVSVASAATYRIWSRVMPADATNNSYALEIDGGNCITVGNSAALSQKEWVWVDYQGGSTANKIDVSLSAGTHAIKLIGTEPGMTVDRLYLTTDSEIAPASAAVTPDGSPIVTSTQGKGKSSTAPTVSVGPQAAETPNADSSSTPKRTISTTSSPKTVVAGTELPLSPVAATAALSALVVLAFGFVMLRMYIRRRAWRARHLVAAVPGPSVPVAPIVAQEEDVPVGQPEPMSVDPVVAPEQAAPVVPVAPPPPPPPPSEPIAVPAENVAEEAAPEEVTTVYQPADQSAGTVIVAGSVTPASPQPAPGATITPSNPHELEF